MEFLAEFFLEIYMELMMLVIPEKNITKKHRIIAKIIAICVLLILLGLAVWGVALLIDYDDLLGLIPLSIAVIFSVIQIVVGIVLYNKNH